MDSRTPIFAIPTANRARCAVTLKRWKEMGYRTAVLLTADNVPLPHADLVFTIPEWRGWPYAVNTLCAHLPDAEWIVTGGDDHLPDQNVSPEIIAWQCLRHFGNTFGIMQPSGDAYGALEDKRAVVSPWIGRMWRELRPGPLHDGYWHFYADNELMEVAAGLGRMWWRDDLVQYHDHWTRQPVPSRPPYMESAAARLAADRSLFEARKAKDFKG